MDDKVRILQSSPLCLDLTIAQVKKLAAISVYQEFDTAEQLFAEGDKAQGVFILTSGKVKVFKLSAGGKEQILNIFGPGQTVGEAAMFAGGSFPANAMATEPVRALWLGRERLIKLMAWEPHLAMGMLAVMSRRLHHFAKVVDALSLRDVPMRLAQYLQDHSENGNLHTIHLEMKKNELSQRLGTAPETLSRAFAKLEHMQLIENQGAHIKILDYAGLERFAIEGK
jgi:CRP/FNR family transcriptional regulator